MHRVRHNISNFALFATAQIHRKVWSQIPKLLGRPPSPLTGKVSSVLHEVCTASSAVDPTLAENTSPFSPFTMTEE